MQSAALLSDMESFKAANPGCILADFVRWHSPRDWDPETLKLSPRMEVKGNVWQEAWQNAKPVPAKRQKRLFDDTKEAEKVLEYLTQLKPSEAGHLLMPVLCHVSYDMLQKEQKASKTAKIEDLLQNIASKLSLTSRLRSLAEVKHYKSIQDEDLSAEIVRRETLICDILKLIQVAEAKISQAKSLEAKFLKDETLTDFIKELLNNSEVKAIGGSRGPIGQLVTQMFADAFKAQQMDIQDELETRNPFPKPASREFVLKVNCARPYTYSAKCPQRLFCRLRPQEFRIAGAFSVDQQFM